MPKLSKRKRKEAERKRQQKLSAVGYKRSKQCGKKKQYNTLIEAEGYAKMLADPRYRGEQAKELRAYLCQYCDKFHLTSQVKRQELRTT